ncbi:unnamed protein product [Callosobruchus maculatus]|uniref:Nose resistant-to-fluoxetine protein N-terminal domain-containing protein n=1 Tax=Callosobruchus maculatus TaxID=64391 RepID=A0A653DFY8_CALMS|nr:unnamed protein product [Callosobruchus maculatus]
MIWFQGIPDFSFIQRENNKMISLLCVGSTESINLTPFFDCDLTVTVLDATAKPQTGLLEGNIVEVGNMDECMRIRATVDNETIKGKYCSTVANRLKRYKLTLPDNMMVKDIDFSYGLCIPDTCAVEEINDIVHYISDALGSPFYLHFIEDFCFVQERKPFEMKDIFAIIFFSITGIIMLLSTFYDIFVFQKRKDTDKNHSILIAFSMYTNWKKIFSTKKTENNLTCLNGLRVISMMWIILGHLYGIVVMMPKENFLDFIKVHESIEGAFPIAANLAVDTFFVVGGLLVSYVFLTLEDMRININFFWFYLHRFMRLTPSLLALIIFCVTLMDRIAYGPFWTLAVYKIKNTCIKNWWSTLLYVQNYVNPTNTCLSHTWYIAVDMQYCIITPPLLILLRRAPKFTMFIAAAIAVMSCTAFFLISWFFELGPSAVGINDSVLKYVYVTPHTRASSWMIGFLFGYILYSYRDKPLKLSQFTKWFAWSVLIGSMAALVLYHKRFLHQGPWPRLETSLFNSLTRPAWSIALCGVIFLCVMGHGDAVNSILSKPIFTVLIRINYNVYLMHVIALVSTYGSFKAPYFGEAYRVLVDFWSVYILTLFLALIWTLAFESPFIAIEGNLRKSEYL